MTAYVARLRRVAAFSYLRLLQLTLSHLVAQSHLWHQVPDPRPLRLITEGFVRVNGSVIRNPLQQLCRADVVWFAASVWVPPYPGGGSAAKVRAGADTPAYLEVDELTQSFVVLQEPRAGLLHSTESVGLPFLTIKCYN
jgi:hypothetical protein